jgi:archaellin
MSSSTLSTKTVCVSLVLILFVVIPGCSMTPPGSDGTIPVTSLPSATAPPVPPPTSNSGQSVANVQLAGNVYGISSDPLRGIDTITFSLGVPSQASAVDLTGMEIVFSTPSSVPVTLTQGTRDSTGIFTTTTGGNAVTMIHPGDQVEISFRVKAVSGGTSVNIEVRPSVCAALPISRIVPTLVSSTNVLL